MPWRIDMIDQSKLDSPVGGSFGTSWTARSARHTVVWVNDPDELFPAFIAGKKVDAGR